MRSAARALPDADELLALPRQRLDHAAAGLARALRANAQIHRVAFSRIGGRLNAAIAARTNVERRRERFGGLAQRLRASLSANIAAAQHPDCAADMSVSPLSPPAAERAMGVLLDRLDARLERAEQLLTAISYRGVLARGFALVRDAVGHPLHAAAGITSGKRLDIEFADGRVGAVAGDARMTPQAETVPPIRRRRRRPDGGEGQGSLF